MTTRNKIINSAIKNFLNFGYDKTTLNMIAEDVGIKKPSIYYHFKNKEELFIVSINYILDSLKENIFESIKKVETSKQMLENLFNSLIEYNSNLSIVIGNSYDTPTNILALFHMSSNKFPYLSEKVDDYYDYLNDTIISIIRLGRKENNIRKDLDERSLALQIIAWFEGMFLLTTTYSSFNINIIRHNLNDNMWKMLSAEDGSKMVQKPKKGFFNRKPISKTIPIGTKW